MPSKRFPSRPFLVTLVVFGFLIYGWLHTGVRSPEKSAPTFATAATSSPPASVPAPSLPTSTPSLPVAPTQPLPPATQAWIDLRFPGSRVVERRETLPDAAGNFQREFLLETHFKYAPVEVAETWQRAPGPGMETVQVREAWAADHLLFKPRAGASLDQLEAAVRQAGGSVDRALLAESGWLTVFLSQHHLGAVKATAAQLARVGGPAAVAEPDYLYFTAAMPNDPSYSQQAALRPSAYHYDIDAEAGWDIRTSAAQVLVAVIDTGVRYTHQDLVANMWLNPGETAGDGVDNDHDGFVDDVHGVNFYGNNSDPSDDEGHGTHVAGILGASGNDGIGIAGVAWQVKILPIKFQDSHGVGSALDAVRAINYAIAKGAQIMNNSWGSYSFSQALHDAVAAARDAGILFTAAAGNDRYDTDAKPEYPAGYDLENVISVGYLAGAIANYYSNFGTVSVDLFAPGTSIYSLGNASDMAYQTLSGSSQATPFVTGTLALLKAQFPDKTAAWLKQRLLETARPNTYLSNLSATGAQLDLYNALVGATPAPVAITTPPAPSDNFTGETLTLSVEATGGGAVSYQWFKDGVALSGQTSAMLTVANAGTGDAGSYYVVIHNYASTITSTPVTVTVKAQAPKVTLAPVAVTALAGQQVAFHAAFKGSLPLSIQWELDGAAIDGATSPDLFIAKVAATQGGMYRAKATNAYGSVYTDAVPLTLVESYLEKWEQVAPAPTISDYLDVKWLNGQFVAVGRGGTVALSADGEKWQLPSTPTTADLYAVTYGAGVLAAVGTGGTVITSPDGHTWSLQTLGYSDNLYDVAYGNGTFVAVNQFIAYTSADGIHWQYNRVDQNGVAYGPTVAFGNGVFVLAGESNNNNEAIAYTSANGVIWAVTSRQPYWGPGKVSFGEGKFWLADRVSTYSSTTGAGWSLFRGGGGGRPAPIGGSLYESYDYSSAIYRFSSTDSSADSESLFYDNNFGSIASFAAGGTPQRIVAVAGRGGILLSRDGQTFTNVSDFTTQGVLGVVYVNGKYVTVDATGKVFVSTDGTAWSHLSDLPLPPGSYTSVSTLAAGNGVIAVTDSSSHVYRSDDGVNWTSQVVVQDNYGVGKVVFVGGYFWVSNYYGSSVFRSADALTWTTVAAKVPVVYGGGVWLSLVSYGAASYSTDAGVTWLPSNFISDFSGAACYAKGRFYVLNGYSLVTSLDGISWTSSSITGLNDSPFKLFYKDGLFVAAGYSSTSASLDGLTWAQERSSPFYFYAEAPDSVVAVGSTGGPANLIRAAMPSPEPVTAPVVLTAPATGVGSRQVIMHGTVEPGGAAASPFFQYGTTMGLGQTLPAPAPSQLRGVQSVAATLPNLQPGTLYYYRLGALNDVGTNYGESQSFTTLPNSPPVAVNDGPILLSGVQERDIGVLNNDSDADGASDHLTVQSVTQGASGTVSINPPGATIHYAPHAGFPGADQFTYTIVDLSGATATATVKVRNNTAPVAPDQGPYDLRGRGPFTLHVLEGVTDPDGDPLKLSSVTPLGAGTETLSVYDVIYQPPPGFAGTDSFRVDLTDTYGAPASFKVTVRISGGRPATTQVTTAARSGDLVTSPDLAVTLPADAKITAFGPPALSDSRRLASTVTVQAGRVSYPGIGSAQEGENMELRALVGQPAPGLEPMVFQSFSHPVLSPQGRLAFIAKAKVRGKSGAGVTGLWSDLLTTGGTLAPALSPGQVLFEPGGASFDELAGISSVAATDDALYALVQLAKPRVNALVRIDGNGPVVVLRAQANSPGHEGTITQLSLLQPAPGSAGQGRWGGAQGFVAKAVLTGGAAQMLVRIAPDGTTSSLLNSGQIQDSPPTVPWSAFGLPAIGADGGAVFSGTLKTSGHRALGRRELGNADTKLSEETQSAPGAEPATFASFYDPLAGEKGLAFLATLRGQGVTAANRIGLWWSDFSTAHKLARLGEAAPDADGHLATPASAGPRWQALSSVALPGGAEGGPVVLGKVSGKTVTTANATGLWALDSTGVFRQIFRTGPNTIDGATKHVVSFAALGADAGAFGVGRSYNATGSLAVRVVYSDHTQALLRLDLP